jgi:iron complex outermembrane receptor protein
MYQNNFGTFTEYALPLSEQISLTAGLRGDLTWIEAEKSNTPAATSSRTDFGGVSANLQLTYKPVKQVELFLGLGRGVRTPDPEELYIDVPAMAPAVTWRGNPGLDKTVNHEADLGVKYTGDRFYVSTSVFYSDLSDYINFFQASNTLKSYQNIDASMWGAELGSQVSLPLDLYLRGRFTPKEGTRRPSPSEIPPLKGMHCA